MNKIKRHDIYTIETNDKNVIQRIWVDTPQTYKRVYIYKWIKKYGAYSLQTNLKYRTFINGDYIMF